jgi:hypothetical protein
VSAFGFNLSCICRLLLASSIAVTLAAAPSHASTVDSCLGAYEAWLTRQQAHANYRYELEIIGGARRDGSAVEHTFIKGHVIAADGAVRIAQVTSQETATDEAERPARTDHFLYADGQASQWSESPSGVRKMVVTRTRAEDRLSRWRGSAGGAAMGIVHSPSSDTLVPVSQLIREATSASISTSPGTDQAVISFDLSTGGSGTCAFGPDGSFRGLRMVRRGGDMADGETLPVDHGPKRRGVAEHVEAIEVDPKTGPNALPTQAVHRVSRHFIDGGSYTTVTTIRIVPSDHRVPAAELRALPLAEGTPVSWLRGEGGGLLWEWRRGEIRPVADPDVARTLRAEVVASGQAPSQLPGVRFNWTMLQVLGGLAGGLVLGAALVFLILRLRGDGSRRGSGGIS